MGTNIYNRSSKNNKQQYSEWKYNAEDDAYKVCCLNKCPHNEVLGKKNFIFKSHKINTIIKVLTKLNANLHVHSVDRKGLRHRALRREVRRDVIGPGHGGGDRVLPTGP